MSINFPKKPVVHEASNHNLFDDEQTRLTKRKTELESKHHTKQLSSEEKAELKEINRRLAKINDTKSLKPKNAPSVWNTYRNSSNSKN